ncbi:hypothetical protein J4217_03455 [Candidatus Pacearchaeota archaeon]|nr:hypothetical protein [Candidatus Pacearchaeota archaeon]
MPQISKEKKEKISEQILHYLFFVSPSNAYTSIIAKEIARDEEFVKLLLTDLEKQKLIICINLNSQGIKYSRRQRWRLSNEAYLVYKKHQQVLDKKVVPQNTESIDDLDNNPQ